MHPATDAGLVGGGQQVLGGDHIGVVEHLPMFAALVTVAEVSGGMNECIAPFQLRAKRINFLQVALNQFDRQVTKLFSRFIDGANQCSYFDIAL